ncbi:MAG: ABC transporter ATP-binding protein [Spirochaetales bacterium]|nr:ABC transporter ATP-binding protein [Spirochaetales bacterium]
MIKIENLYRGYGTGDKKVTAVKDLSLEVKKGELFGFLGPNGAGKTTTIKILVGLLKADNGKVYINDIDISKKSLKAKSITGFVPEEPVLYEKMTGMKFFSFIADVYNVPLSRRKSIIELAELFELHDALNDPISVYSHGMRQKVSIISAMLHDPEILIMDEPIIGLDPKASFHFKEKLREYCKMGKTVFFSTHVMEVAERLCDRVGIINKGELLAAAPFAKLREIEGKKNATLEQLFLEMTDEDT